jgi:hypothetical protein
MVKSAANRPQGCKRRNAKEIKEFFSQKMNMLSKACASPEVTAQEFRVFYALTIGHLSNETDWCQPKDETLGQSCATCTRSVGTHTRSLVAKGWITKKQTLHASKYEFLGITSCRQLPADMPQFMSATPSVHVSNSERPCRHTACRTEPSLEPSLGNGSAAPSPLNSEASASPENGIRGERVEKRSLSSQPHSVLDSQKPPKADSPPPPSSALPPLPRLRGMFIPPKPEAQAEQRLGNDILALPHVLDWVEPESDAYRLAVAAEMKEKGSGARMLVAAWEANEKEKLTCQQQS